MSAGLVAGVAVGSPPRDGLVAARAVAPAADESAPVTSRPDVVSARIAAAAQGSRVEVTDLEDEYSTTYVNPDGTETTETSQAPVRVMQGGAWVPVDYTLQHVDGGWAPAASPVPVVFSDGNDQDAVTLGDGSKELDLSWDVTLPAPTVNGPSATYDLGGGESLVLTATSTGFEQSLVLASAPTSLPQIKLPFDSSGLTMTADSTGGGYEFDNAAGTAVYDMPAPIMYGAAVDPDSGEPTQTQVVSSTLVDTDNGPRLDLSPSLSWLQSSNVTYPVTIDPEVSVTDSGDQFVASNISTNNLGTVTLHAGEYHGYASRTYLNFNNGLSAYAGKDIENATLNLYENDANTCTAATIHGYPLTQPATDQTTWSNKPTFSTSSTYAASASFAKGTSGSCPDGWVSMDVTKIFSGWINGGLTNDGLQLSGTETSGAQGWSFCSRNPGTSNTVCLYSSRSPYVSITYNSIPTTPGGRTSLPCTSACNSARQTDTTRPTLSATSNDADGGTLTYDYEIYNAANGNPTTLATSGSVSGVTAGQQAQWIVPSGQLSDGNWYFWRVRAYDGTDYSPWTSEITLHVDTTAPATPTLSSGTWTSGAWTSTNLGTVSWSSTSSDVANYQYQLDGGEWTPTTKTSQSFDFTSNALHVLNVQAVDIAGNVSNTATFTVGEGAGALTSPTDGTDTQKQVLLTSAAPAGSYVQYQYQQGTTSSWTPVPSSDVLGESSGNAPTNWPWTPAATSDTSQTATAATNWLWNAHHTLGTDSGTFEVRACFSASSSGSNPTCQSTFSTVTLSTGAFDDADTTTQVGPGQLSEVTGDYSISATDADIAAYDGGLSVSRTLTTLDPAAATTTAAGVFGPGWTSSLDGPDAGDADLTPTLATDKSSIAFTDSTGSNAGTYTATTALTGSSITYTGTGSANDGSTATYYTAAACPASPSPGTPCITLTHPGDSTTTWTQPSGTGLWAPYSVVAVPTDSGETTSSYYYNSNGLPTRIVAPAPSGVVCSTQAKATSTEGCRSLSFAYTGITVGGSTVQRLTSVSLTAYNPATSAMATTAVAAYDYDSSGRLADAWDPRISPALKTSYTYDANNRLATLTPPGLNPWSFSYDAQNRLSTVSRPDPSGSTATTTIVYDIPTTGSNVPTAPDGTTVTLDGAHTSTWGQTADLPSTGVAIFPATHVPAGTTPSTVTSTDWPWASITYMDYLGQDVDDVDWGAGAWQIGATQYDNDGDTVWSITPGNLSQALNPTPDTDPYVASLSNSAARANLLATVDTYDANDDLLDEQGPMHPVVVTSGSSAGDTIDARAHSVYGYDSGSPDGNYYGLQTSDAESAVDITGTDYDTQTTTTTYAPVSNGEASGWDLGEPTTSTDPGGLETIDHYNAAGQLTAEQLPADSGNAGFRTTDTTYYTTGNGSGCANTAFVGLVCTTQPAAQPNTGDPLPVVTYSYNMYDDPTAKTETYGTGSSQVVRTTTTTYDAAERKIGSAIAVTPASAGGTALPAVSYAYDPSTGLPTTTSTGSGSNQQTLTSGYNAVGEQASYTDATGNQSSMTYDLDGRLASLNDGKGTTTYSYDTNSEHRGLVTSENIGVSGAPSTFTANYDAAGDMSIENYPNGLVATTDYDNADEPIQLQYTDAGSTWMTFANAYNTHGQVAIESSPESNQAFTYDDSNRLTGVQDTYNGACTTRAYSYDNESNRTALASYSANSDGSCSSNNASVVASTTYDQADRDSNSGYTYDSLGRTLTVPSTDVQSGTLDLAYFSNDFVASETQSENQITFSLDPEQDRILSSTDADSLSINHYSGPGDDPTWVQTQNSWTRNIVGPQGALAATANSSGEVELQLADLHGNIVATMPDTSASSLDSYGETTEFGVPRSGEIPPSPYGWLGAHERNNQGLGGIVFMGVRLYNPETGQFLSPDPISSGNSNAYTYPTDPINSDDISGKTHISCVWTGTCRIYLSKKLTHYVAWYGAVPGVLAAAIPVAGVILAADMAMWVGAAWNAMYDHEDLGIRFNAYLSSVCPLAASPFFFHREHRHY